MNPAQKISTSETSVVSPAPLRPVPAALPSSPRREDEIAIAQADKPNRGPNFPPLKSWPGAAVMCWIGTTLIGAAGLFGWFGGVSVFASFGRHYIPIAHSEATILIVMGFILVFYVCGISRRIVKPATALILVFTAVFSVLKLTELFGNANFGIERVFHLTPTAFRSVVVGRMSPVTAFNFLLTSLALFLMIHISDQRQRAIRWAANLNCSAAAITLTVVLGYFYGNPLLYGGSIIPMSLPTAISFCFLLAGNVIAIGPNHLPLRPLMGDSPQARLLRAFLPVPIVAVIINGFLFHALPFELQGNGALVSSFSALVGLLVTMLTVSRLAVILGGAMAAAEESRNEAQGQLREQAILIDLSPDAIFTMSLDGRIELWNEASARLFGWSDEEARGKDAMGLLFRSGIVSLADLVPQLMEHGEAEYESVEQDKAGESVTVLSRFTLVHGNDGRQAMILVICRDITEKKASEAQRLRSERLQSIGTLASGIAHDVNNALLPIFFAAELLKRETAAEKRDTFIDQVIHNAERVRSIVKQILLFVGGGNVGKQAFNLMQLLKNTDQMLQHTLPKTIEIHVSIPDGLWGVLGDETQISQVLMNLCINARDAMGDRGVLNIVAENAVVDGTQAAQYSQATAGPHVHLTVSDTGSGIPPEIVDKIFDPFFTTKGTGKGTGLGLSTVLGIVESHRGFLGVHSQSGKGTRFEIWLPAAAEARENELLLPEEAPRGNGETILVVDDEEDIRAIAKEVLEENGYVALGAADGTEAVALFAQNHGKIKAVLCDMMMPVMDGATTIRALKKLDPEMPVIAMSGLIEERANSAKIAGASALLEKPFTANTLLTTVARWIQRKSAAA